MSDARGRRLILVTSFGFTVAFSLAIALYGLHPTRWLYTLSWNQADIPLMPAGQAATPIWGPHYFGDWQVFVGWARQKHPYWGDGGHLTVLPPVLWALRGASHLPMAASYMLVVVLGVAVSAGAVWLLGRDLPFRTRAAAWMVFCVASIGFITCTDRGNLQTLTTGVVGLWIWALRTRRGWTAALLLALAICLKPYLVPLLLWPIVGRDWRHVARVIAAVAVPTLVGFTLEPGSLAQNITGYLGVHGAYADHGGLTDDLMLSTTSALGVIVHPVTLFAGLDIGWTFLLRLPSWVLLAPGLIWAAVVTYIVARRRLSEALRWCFMLSVSQMLLPAAQIYSMGWAGLAALLLVTAPTDPRESSTRRMVEIALIATIVPVPIIFGGYMAMPLSIYLSPLLWTAAGLWAALATARAEAEAPHVVPADRVLRARKPETAWEVV